MNTKTTNPLDKHLDAILRASGSALRNYGTSGKTIDDMRAALSAAVAELAPANTIINQIADGWDGCMYDAPSETIDIGADIRAAFEQMAPGSSCAPRLPVADL